jgi:hypothetical protein
MSHVERFYPRFEKMSAVGITRTPETDVVMVTHVDVHAPPAHLTLRAVLNAGLIGIVDNEMVLANFAKIAPFACCGLPEVIPRLGTAART